MSSRLVDSGWSKEIVDALRVDGSELRIVSPFIKAGALRRLDMARPNVIKVLTRFSLADFADGVSDIEALRKLLVAGASIRGVRNLHAKMYLFGGTRAIVTSANLTEAALARNHEFGLISDEPAILAACRTYFDNLWNRGGEDLKLGQLDEWQNIVTRCIATGGSVPRPAELGDFGADVGAVSVSPIPMPPSVSDAPQAFVKFLGEGHNRVPLSTPTIDEIQRSGCHWAVAYPATKRPRSVNDNAVIYVARLTSDPNDIRIFGRAIGMRHVPGRDDATPQDIALRGWKETWSRYVRVHHAEFVAGTMSNGVSLNELMNDLGSNSFAPTKRNAARGDGNVDPRKAYQQQAAVELSDLGASWLGERLQASFDAKGKIPQSALAELDWPEVP